MFDVWIHFANDRDCNHDSFYAAVKRTTDETADKSAMARALAAPGGVRTIEAFSQDKYYDEADLDAENGCIREAEHAYSADGGLAVCTATSPKTAAS